MNNDDRKQRVEHDCSELMVLMTEEDPIDLVEMNGWVNGDPSAPDTASDQEPDWITARAQVGFLSDDQSARFIFPHGSDPEALSRLLRKMADLLDQRPLGQQIANLILASDGKPDTFDPSFDGGRHVHNAIAEYRRWKAELDREQSAGGVAADVGA